MFTQEQLTALGKFGNADTYPNKTEATAILNAHNADVNAHKPLMDMIARISIKVTSWEAFRRLCRAGCIREHYSVGDQLQCNKGDITLTWDIVHIGDVGGRGGNYVILQTHDCLPMGVMEFDSREAIFRTKTELPAGTYHFTAVTSGITDSNWTDPSESGWTKTWQFTLTKAVPAGGQINFAKWMDFNTSVS